jgi:stage II sporulation protein D
VMNRVGLEQYLHSVICSEMNPGCPQEFLRAHCIISRSWLLAQLERKQGPACSTAESRLWTDAAVHRHFDVCADDHCQRYHGIAALNPAARAALGHTRGQVLLCGDEVCDARFSKCCGGITERFSTAWQDVEFEYLQPVTDAPAEIPGVPVPLMTEMDAERFIRSRPAAYCNVADRDLLSRILPDFDLETGDFFRWEVVLPQEKLRELLLKKSGIDFGCVRELRVLQRGASGRIMQLQVLGERAEKIFSKELAIRSALSTSHLYSSCFIVERGAVRQGVPETFMLKGAGWGHGVGLCQIGAAAMAHAGVSCAGILAHYFKGTAIATLY